MALVSALKKCASTSIGALFANDCKIMGIFSRNSSSTVEYQLQQDH